MCTNWTKMVMQEKLIQKHWIVHEKCLDNLEKRDLRFAQKIEDRETHKRERMIPTGSTLNVSDACWLEWTPAAAGARALSLPCFSLAALHRRTLTHY